LEQETSYYIRVLEKERENKCVIDCLYNYQLVGAETLVRRNLLDSEAKENSFGFGRVQVPQTTW